MNSFSQSLSSYPLGHPTEQGGEPVPSYLSFKGFGHETGLTAIQKDQSMISTYQSNQRFVTLVCGFFCNVVARNRISDIVDSVNSLGNRVGWLIRDRIHFGAVW